ncbi:MAG: hypothetical protein IKU69_07980 [Roseburia sp.]|nr:hypothetical protein [Roseburia sp.]
MRKKRRRGNYKFTEKKQSKRGIAGFLIAAVSIGIFIYVVWNSYTHRGAGSMYLGSAGVTSMILAVVATVFSVMSLKEENSFKVFPYLGTVCSVVALVTWIALYVMGMILA